MSSNSVIFMGSPSFAVPTLEALVESIDFDVICVVTQPDRPSGRGKKLAPTEVKTAALAHKLPVLDMTKDSYADVARELAGLKPDFIVVVAFGVILKSDLLNLPAYACVNLHASLLPKYRGVSPIHAVILAGEPQAGCTTMIMDEGIDTGDILLTSATPIHASDTTGVLEARLAELGAPLMVKTLAALRDGTVEPQAQDPERATYTKKIRKKHGRIDWNRPAQEIARRIRAMQPWPTAYTGFNGKRLIVVEAVVAATGGGTRPGTVISVQPLTVAAGEGALVLRRVKPEGKKEMGAEAYVAGYRVEPGAAFESPPV